MFIYEAILTVAILALLSVITAGLLEGAYWMVSRYLPPFTKVFISNLASLFLSLIGYVLFSICVITIYPETLYDSTSSTFIQFIYLPIALIIQTAINGLLIKKPDTTKRVNFTKACLASMSLDVVIILSFCVFN